MKLKKEPYIISKAEADWIASAIARDSHRLALTYAALSNVNGTAVLVSTDTHRLHILKLGTAEDGWLEPGKSKLIDIRRIIHEAKFSKATHIGIEQDASRVTLGKMDKKSAFVEEPLYAPAFPETDVTYPNFERVIPTKRVPVSEIIAVNYTFLVDAAKLGAVERIMRTYLYQEHKSGPIVVSPGTEERWLAIVMPMSPDAFTVKPLGATK